MRCTQSVITAAALFGAAIPAQAETVTFSALGGDFQKALVRAIVAPAAKAVGVDLREDTNTLLPGIRLQVQSGKPAWDIVHLGCHLTAAGEEEGLWENITTAKSFPMDIPSVVRSDKWVGANYYSTVLAYRTDVYKDNPPKTWADFWDTKKFPGRRALGNYPQEMMEIALMADGVEKDKLYPLDVERALKSLRKIKPEIAVWWSSGGQASQLLVNHEVDMIATWTSRVEAALADKAPVGFTYNQGILGAACLAIPKGSAHVEAASKMIDRMLQPDIQANIPEMLSYYGAINQKAYQGRTISPNMLKLSNATPENEALQVRSDPRWWADNIGSMTDKYKAMMAE